MLSENNQTIIITGASRGLGAATAHIAAELGANVVLSARAGSALNQVAADIRAASGQALPVAGDVSQVDVCHRIVAQALVELLTDFYTRSAR